MSNFEATDTRGNWTTSVQKEIQHAAITGKHLVEGKGSPRPFLNWDSLMFLPAQIKNAPLLGSEPVNTAVTIGPKAKKPVQLQTPVMVGAMSFGAMSIEAKVAIARAVNAIGSMTNTGEGGMHPRERQEAKLLAAQYSTGRFGVSDEYLAQADMIEIKLGQGAKPGLGGHLLKEKITDEIAAIRKISKDQNAISPARHPDINSPKDLADTIKMLKEKGNGVPVAVKIAGGHVEEDLDVLFSLGELPDALIIDGAEGGTGAAPVFARDHVALPLFYFLPRVVQVFAKKKLKGKVTLIATGGLRGAADIAKVLALGADAVQICSSVQMAMGCSMCRQCQVGKCPLGIATQDESLRAKANIDELAGKVINFLKVTTEDVANFCRITGKNDIAKLSKDDLVALDELSAKISGVKLA